MCGIVGYVGREDRCVEVLLEGLRHLEYRGYDSAGLALQRPDRIERIRRVGHLENLERALRERNGDYSRVTTGVGHTRWATHGRPSEENAHPHLGGSGAVAVVHNGIIENFAALKAELEGRGVRFDSETDTEVVAHLLEERVLAGAGLREAFAEILPRLEGTFAIAAISMKEPGRIVAARHQSPLVVGLGEGESFLASGIPALLGRTRRFLLVENGEVAELTADSARIFDADGRPVERGVFEVDWDAEAVELGGFESYMLKEIHEQPTALRATLAEYLGPEGEVDLSPAGLSLADVGRVVVVACGTAYHAGLLGKTYIERLAGLPVEVSVASEYRYSDPLGDERTLVVAISQSGETIDTLAAVEAARGFGGKVLAITNTRGSLITREADAVLLTGAGPEIGVAATKTFLTQISALQALALALAAARKTLPEDELLRLGRGLRRLPERVEEALGLAEPAAWKAAGLFEEARCALFLGRGPAYPVALEGALKLKEISYLPAEGYPAGEMKHGPIALVDERCPVVAVIGEGLLREKTLSNIEETVARGAPVVAVADPGDRQARRVSRLLLPVPGDDGLLGPYLWTVPLQLLAYHVARARGLDVDKPRNLAKSVTVE
ncbi:glutamine--fructose-6-phosphate aminotransferase [isomerizing] [Rubrobacter xylanophilus]|uniref:Glutamine--fructose-6-phosphate aminotransferase [isomerizing] n=1 Tax=Rubrobacter xylanophilus TaxID=49319 RepID=A0A510HE52_9ACTN|nr:glutamine--fructose-6-phosphate transaminase (isomerizing) [Rubrobacter xylanophilus]BBL78222.1 glutamine--fructose-6-phosphate aminotransferase [isomerizing] [Rubrobacter xylanophilus]